MDAKVNTLVKAFLNVRKARGELKEEFESRDRELLEDMEVIENALLETCKTTGAEAIRTKYGTAYRQVRTRYWTNDWDSMYKFVQENDAPELLEKRLHQTNVKGWLEEHPDKLPPGLNADSRFHISVRSK